MITLTRDLVSDLAAPFDGVKQSGLGREAAACRIAAHRAIGIRKR